jgi:hypothetical protein
VELFPALPLDEWRGTKETLHRFTQVVGKIRLAGSPRRNHWWNVPFHVTGQGITTRPMGPVHGGDAFCVDFDFVDHRLVIRTLAGRAEAFPLTGRSVGDFYRDTLRALVALGLDAEPRHPYPYDLPDARRPFADDDEHREYDPEAVTRVSDREVPQPPDADPVTREAYSREVISSGFWFGDDTVPAPAFYSYTAPEPPGLAAKPLEPAAAHWSEARGSHIALLMYDDVRASADPWATALRFFDSAYRAGAELTGWERREECAECPGGVTDPQLAA